MVRRRSGPPLASSSALRMRRVGPAVADLLACLHGQAAWGSARIDTAAPERESRTVHARSSFFGGSCTRWHSGENLEVFASKRNASWSTARWSRAHHAQQLVRPNP